ncbi:DUF397 domain-containing protein [Amycolatopsis samaneae]|uniref:DUF397 domain-containing protein n=1 Tax=Amycolatopsis samaneae TaxID=664691 RepID=A0ABW5GGM3_9PSEU
MTTARWRTSSYSGADANKTECVEVAAMEDRALIRDTKDRAGGLLAVGRPGYDAFISAVKTRDVA